MSFGKNKKNKYCDISRVHRYGEHTVCINVLSRKWTLWNTMYFRHGNQQ